MRKWALAAVLYLLVVIGGYTVYAQLVEDETVSTIDANTKIHQEDDKSHEHNEDSKSTEVTGEIQASLKYEDGQILITLTDSSGNPVEKLDINHEKLMHLIVVNDSLQQYLHLHPEKTNPGEFKVQQDLAKGEYKAFIDVKPSELSYKVAPITIEVGDVIAHEHHEGLKPDSTYTKVVDNQTVTLNMSSTKVNESITLSFELDQSTLEPYLGALGHVVILDEKADKYVHVHPSSGDQPVFETEFDQPGVYKIWAEFKQEGQVRVFPFVVNIE